MIIGDVWREIGVILKQSRLILHMVEDVCLVSHEKSVGGGLRLPVQVLIHQRVRFCKLIDRTGQRTPANPLANPVELVVELTDDVEQLPRWLVVWCFD